MDDLKDTLRSTAELAKAWAEEDRSDRAAREAEARLNADKNAAQLREAIQATVRQLTRRG